MRKILSVLPTLELVLQMFKCFFLPERCIESSTKEDLEYNLKLGQAWHGTYASIKEVPLEKVKETQENEEKRVKTLRSSIFQSFLRSAILLILALLIGSIIKPDWWPPSLGLGLGVLSAFLLTWATFGALGWEIRSWKGNTLPERLNKFWFRSLFGTGMILLFTALVVS